MPYWCSVCLYNCQSYQTFKLWSNQLFINFILVYTFTVCCYVAFTQGWRSLRDPWAMPNVTWTLNSLSMNAQQTPLSLKDLADRRVDRRNFDPVLENAVGCKLSMSARGMLKKRPRNAQESPWSPNELGERHINLHNLPMTPNKRSGISMVTLWTLKCPSKNSIELSVISLSHCTNVQETLHGRSTNAEIAQQTPFFGRTRIPETFTQQHLFHGGEVWIHPAYWT